MSELVNMVIMFMVLSGMSGFDLCFSGEILPLKLVMTYSNLVNYVHVGRIKTFFFSLQLVPPEPGDCWIPSSLTM